MKTTRPMPSFNGVAANSTATLDMPIGLSYHGLLLTRGGTFGHDLMTDIRLKANGRELMAMSGAQLDDINVFNGLAAATAALSYIDFERLGLKTRQGVELTSIGTGMPFNNNASDPAYNPLPITNLQLEIDIGAATGPTLSAIAIQSGPRPSGVLLKRRKFTYSIGGAGTFEISDLPRGDNIDKIWIFSSVVTEVQLERDNFLVFDRTAAENNLIQADGVRVPVANLFVIDPSERGNGGDLIVSKSSDFRLKLGASGNGTAVVYVDYLGDIRGN